MRAKVAEIKYVKDPEPMIVAISREHLPPTEQRKMENIAQEEDRRKRNQGTEAR